MRTLLLALLASGCAVSTSSSRGVTRAAYQGGTQVVFTNATPVKMCELRMSADDEPDYGDNWLPAGGLASGASLELHVRPGVYKAMWSTCQGGGADGYYAATLWHDTAVEVQRDVQLYAYVADRVAPTSRAALLGVDYKVVRFQGQAIGPIVASTEQAAAAPHDAFAAVERDIARHSGQRAPEPETQQFEKLGAADFIDPVARKQAKQVKHPKRLRPSVAARTHGLADGALR